MTTTYIIDDDPNAIALLKNLLTPYAITIVGSATTIEQARQELPVMQPDLLFLDVEMPEMSGLDFCTELKQMPLADMKVVFYTGYDKYVLDALRRQAFDYMLKPATPEQLSQLMNRYYEDRLSVLRQARPATAAQSPIVVVDDSGEHKPLRASQIAFFRFNNVRRLWEVVTLKNDSYLLRHRTNADVIMGYSPDFVQIHKRYIVNIQHISRITDSNVFLNPPFDKLDELQIGRTYRHELLDKFYSM